MTGHRMSLWELLFPARHLTHRIDHLETRMSESEDRLNAALAELGTELGDAIDRLEEKLADSNVDLEDEISTVRGFADRLKTVATDPIVEPPVDPDEPVDPEAPVEP